MADLKDGKFNTRSTRKDVTEFIVGRLTNYQDTAEGPILPPKQQGPFRIPLVNAVKLERRQQILGSGKTYFTVSFMEPFDLDNIDSFRIYVRGAIADTNQLIGPITCSGSPAIVPVDTTKTTNITIYVQTVLKNGFVSDLLSSPTCSARTFAP